MNGQEGIADLLNSTIESVGQVIPIPMEIEPSVEYQQTNIQSELGVLVGITGDVVGRIVIEGENETFGKLSESMFGMPMEGAMLHSFVGEIANMIAGNTSTFISQKGRKIDITPPTIVAGQFQLFGFERGLAVPLHIANVGRMNIILLLQKEKAA